MPTLNEGRNLEYVLRRLPVDLYELVLVDGHSVDNTIEVARGLRRDATVISQNRRGKGNALACGFAASSGDVIVTIDADGSADPAEIPSFVAALTAGADFAKGSRFLDGGGSRDITRLRKTGNFALIALVNRLFATNFTDLCYGYNAFWRHCLPAFELNVGESGESVWGDGFEIETLLSVRAARAGARITEVASTEHRRVHGASHLNTFRDGWRVLRTIDRERRRETPRASQPLSSTAISASRHQPVDRRALPTRATQTPLANPVRPVEIDLTEAGDARRASGPVSRSGAALHPVESGPR